MNAIDNKGVTGAMWCDYIFAVLLVNYPTFSITGATSAHILINYGNDGTTAEILIMDTKDKATATNVLRLNQAGMSFSTTGYTGEFTAAISIDASLFAKLKN